MVQISACDSLTNWTSTGGTNELDTTDIQEGTASLKTTGLASPPNFIDEIYDPAGTWNWSTYEYIVFWFKTQQRDNLKFRIWSGATEDDDYIEWTTQFKNQVIAINTWYRVKLYLNDYDGSSGTISLAAVKALKAQVYQTTSNKIFWLDDVRVELYDPVKVKIGSDYVSDDALELDIWGDDLRVGRWELLLKNTNDKHGGRFHSNEVVEIEINSVSMMKGYLDDVFPHLSDRGVYTNQLKTVGRDYARDLARLMYAGAFTGIKGDDLIDAILAAKGSEITFDSPHEGGYLTMKRGRIYILDWLQEVATRTNMNYSAYVRQDKVLRLFPVGDAGESSGVALKLVAAALDNNILHLLKGEEIGISIYNDVTLSAGSLNDHWTDGNHAAFTVGTGVYTPESCDTAGYYLDGTSSIKFGCLTDNDLMTIYLDFSGTLYNYSSFDLSRPEECYFLIKPVCHKAGSIWVNARPWLEDSSGCRIEFKRTGAIPFLSAKGKTDDLSEGTEDEHWHKVTFTVGDIDVKSVRRNNKWGKIAGSLPFDWTSVVKIGINIICPGNWGAIDCYLDSLSIPSIEVISQASDATSDTEYGTSEWFDQRSDIKSQIELDAARANELEKRKDPLKNIVIIAVGQTGIKYAGQSVTVQAPGHGIADATKYRIVSYHHQVRKDPIKLGYNFITTLDLVSDELSPTTQVIDPRRYMLSKDPVGAALDILALANRRLRSAETTQRKGFGDTLPVDKIFYSGQGTAFPADPNDGFVYWLTADYDSYIKGFYQYNLGTTTWILIGLPYVRTGAAFPSSPENGEIYTHTGWGMQFRWDSSNNWWVAIDYDGTKATLVTVDAAGTSITIQDATTGITITGNTTGITVQSNATGITINSGATSISINKNTSNITIIDHATGLTIQVNATGLTIQDADADTSVVSDNSNVTAQSSLLDWTAVGTYTGTLTAAFGLSNNKQICTLPANCEALIECGIGLDPGSPDTSAGCYFFFYFLRSGTSRFQIGSPMFNWMTKDAGIYPWRGTLHDYTGASNNSVRLWLTNKKTSGSITLQYRVVVQKRLAHTHTMNDPNHPHGTTDPGHDHTPTDPDHDHTPTDPDHDHDTQEPDSGQGHPHTPTDPGHPHNKTDPTHAHSKSDPGHPHGKTDPGHPHTPTDPTHPHDITDPEHKHEVTKTDDPP